MSKSHAAALFVSAVLGLSLSAPMKADTLLTSSLPEFTGNFYDFSATYPLASVTIGTFTYVIPAGDNIVSATVSGSFGNSSANSTALSDYYVGGILVASCSSFSDPCFNPSDPFDPPEAWSYTFTPSEFSALMSGSADFTVIQTGPFVVESGVTTLDVVASPEPSSIVLLAAAAGALLFVLRKRRVGGAKTLGAVAAVSVALLASPQMQAQVNWTASTSPVQATIAGGPWTIPQGQPQGPFSGPEPYCNSSGVPIVNSSSTVNTMQPFYAPLIIGTGLNLQGYFDYRPRDINEATVAANSTDGGLSWHFQEEVEQLTSTCPSSNSGGNSEDGAGHPSILSFGGATWLYLLDRSGGKIDSGGLLVYRLSPTTAKPLNPLPLNEYTPPPAAATIARWDFSNFSSTANTSTNSPAPVIGTGTATVLGMTNSYTCTQAPPNVGSTAGADVTQTGGSTDPSTVNSWRVRGKANKTFPCNGWSLSAPPLTQGAEFDVSTSGQTNIVFQYDWYCTNQGVRDQQAQYTTDGTHWTNVGPIQVCSPSLFSNRITIDFGALGITAVNNNAHFGVRLVSVPDPTYTGSVPGGEFAYTGATLGSNGQPALYNNNSGNWRFGVVNVLTGSFPPNPTTKGLINPDGILAAVPGTYPRQVLYIEKTLNGDYSFPTSQQCGDTPSGKAANHDVSQVRFATTMDGVNFTDMGVVNGLNDITTISYSKVRYVAPNGTLVKLAGGKWGLFFGGGNCLDGDSDAFHAIMYAESTDLKNWTVVNGLNNPIASVSTVTATDPVTMTSVTIPSTPPVVGATQSWFAGRVYSPNAMFLDSHTINLIFAGYNAGYSSDLSSYRTIGHVTLSSGSTTLP